MKNHIIFKFLAVLLCAASLLGTVGGALGVFALTEADLYDRSAEEVYAEQLEIRGRDFAEYTARRYASADLGGMPMETVDQVLGFPVYLKSPYYGYRLLDAEGKELESREISSGDEAKTYTYKVSGQYLHLVEKTTISQELEKQENNVPVMDRSYDVLVDEIPDEGATVSRIQFSSGESSSSGAEVDALINGKIGSRIQTVLLQNIFENHLGHAPFSSAKDICAFQVFPFEFRYGLSGNQEVAGPLCKLGKIYQGIVCFAVINVYRAFGPHKSDIGIPGQNGSGGFICTEAGNKRKVDSFFFKVA